MSLEPCMFVTFKYRDRNTIIQRLDPRTRLIMFACFLGAAIQFWDLRVLLVFLLLALGQYLLARLTWRETKTFWIAVTALIIFITLINSLTRREMEGVQTYHVLWQGGTFQILSWTLTVSYTIEQAVFAVSMFVRYFSIALFSVIIPYTIHPAQYGIAFRRLGLPDGFSYAMDLAFRFVPSLGEDFSTTYDAQRARGYELERLGGGVVQQIQHLAPLVVPVTLRAILSGEEVVDAMDLRAFGSTKRTWYHELRYSTLDKVVIAASVALLVGSFAAAHLGLGLFWVPEFLIR